MQKAPVVLPPNRTWTQPNTGYIFGSLYSSRNISLDIPGVMSLSSRAKYVGREAVSGSSYRYLVSIVYDGQALTGNERYYLITSNSVYTLSQSLTSFAIDGTASSPSTTLNSDGVLWNDGLYVTTSGNMSKLVSGTWTGSLMSLTSSIPHPLCVSTILNNLLVGNGNKLEQRTPGGSNSTAITIPSNYRIQWIRSDNSRVLIGTRNLNGGYGAVFEWDETSAAATNKFDVDAPWVFAGEFRNTDFFIVVNDGRVMKYNGGGFSTVAQLPIYKSLPGDWINSFAQGSVFQRGIQMIGGRVNIMMSGEIDDTPNEDDLYENQPSGIWEFDESTGLNHKYGPSYSSTGEDYCQMLLGAGAGAIAPIYIDPVTGGPDPNTVGHTLLYGARLSGGAGNDYYTLGTLIYGGVNRGQFETTRVETTDIADNNLKIWCKFRGVFAATDKILFKYKDKYLDDVPFESDVTWVSTTQFTSTDTKWAPVLAAGSNGGGYEVTNLDEAGAGAAAHITAISLNTGTYTVTLDEAIPNITAADTTSVICDNYIKLETTITSADTEGYKEIPIEKQSNPHTWIQLKGELRGSYLVTIEELQLISKTHQLPTA